ncbi:M60 family metallopeptidase [Pontiellaceae bacterium B1224]|nr:M60 family metallopeptidase [Pontiellaceae bacterium B1224]
MKINGFILGIGLLISFPMVGTATQSEGLLKQADAMQRNLDQLGKNESAVAEAFELIGQYDEIDGPLFMNDATRKGLPRNPKVGLELDYAMLAIQQGLIDYTYTAENLKKFHRTLDGAAFESSAYFPGAVEPPDDSSEVQQVRINASQPTAWGSPVSGQENPARRPTGCYLAPGSIALLRVPEALINKGYSVRVGAHSWDLKKKPSIKRLDRVSIVYPITERDTLIANPLGGGIYIEVPYEADAGIVTIAFKNVVRAPFYSARSFDRTSSNDWKKKQQFDAPWSDFESDKFMMQVPTAWLDQIEDPEQLMIDWDKAMDAVSELFGYPLVRPKSVLYLQVDAMMRGNANFPGYPQSNYPYNPHNPEQCRHQWMLKGPQFANWTVLHEVGHSQFFSKFRGEIEALVNLPHVAVMNRKFGWSLDEAYGSSVNNMKHLTLDDVAAMWMVTENFRTGNEMNHSNRPGDEFKYQHRGYGKYVEIANLFGWDALGRFWHADNERWQPGDKVPQNNDPVDDRILRLSKAAGADLTPLIHFWGIQPENPKALAKAIKKEGLEPSKKIYDRLQHYKTVIPMDNAAFRKHTKAVYPKGLGKPKNPLYGTGWYEVWLPKYDEAEGQAAQTALQQIIDQYFKTGTGE